MQTCKPVYQLASRPVRIRNRSPEGGLAATLIARDEPHLWIVLGAKKITPCPFCNPDLPNGTSVHQYTSALLHPPGRPAEAWQKSDRHLELARVLPLGRRRVRSLTEAVLFA